MAAQILKHLVRDHFYHKADHRDRHSDMAVPVCCNSARWKRVLTRFPDHCGSFAAARSLFLFSQAVTQSVQAMSPVTLRQVRPMSNRRSTP